MNNLWICTKNLNKIQEMKAFFLSYPIKIFSLLDISNIADPQENGDTFDNNALIKAQYLAKIINQPVLADDSGLMIKELNNFPGVLTKRWTGSVTDDFLRNEMLLEKCKNIKNRMATSTCALAFVDFQSNKIKQFRVSVEGKIVEKQVKTANGFGYDSIFWLPSKRKTFAEMNLQEKKEFSARGQAIKMFIKWYLANY